MHAAFVSDRVKCIAPLGLRCDANAGARDFDVPCANTVKRVPVVVCCMLVALC